MKSFSLLLVFLHFFTQSISCCEEDSLPEKTNKKKIVLLTTGVNTVYVGSLIALNEAWYKNSPRTSFHFFNDNAEWMQMDKAGHATTAFHESVFAVHALRWTGLSPKKAMWIGSLAGLIYQTPIEYFDGRSPEYGASWGDIVANAAGSGLALGQYLLWNEIRIQPKFSFHKTQYASKRPNTLGSNLPEQLIKDYNGQTYWLSANISSFLKKENSKFPKWINIAFGYGANEMVYATKERNHLNGYSPYRQYYFSLDVDFSHVKTKKKWVKYILYPLNIIHIPFPAVELNKKGLNFHAVYF